MAEKTVLVIDPDITIASIIKKSIVAFDPTVSVVIFSSYIEVQALLGSTSFDCLILDTNSLMEADLNDGSPGIDSIASPSKIVISGYPTDLSSLPEKYRTGFTLIQKPLDANQLTQSLKNIIGEVSTDIVQQVTLDSTQFHFCQGLVRRLRNHLGARMVLLSDTVGRILVSAGEAQETAHDLLCSLLGGSMASLIEASKSLDDPSMVHLLFREGNNNDLYAINVGSSLFLVVVISKTSGFSRLGTTWYYGRQCSIHLNRYFAITNTRQDTNSLIKTSVAEITNELEKLFAQ